MKGANPGLEKDMPTDPIPLSRPDITTAERSLGAGFRRELTARRQNENGSKARDPPDTVIQVRTPRSTIR